MRKHPQNKIQNAKIRKTKKKIFVIFVHIHSKKLKTVTCLYFVSKLLAFIYLQVLISKSFDFPSHFQDGVPDYFLWY
jgi:hypothetical protein